MANWQAIKTDIEKSMEEGSWRTLEIESDGEKIRFQSLNQVMRFYSMVCQKVAECKGDALPTAGPIVMQSRGSYLT